MIPRLFVGNFDFEHRLAEPELELTNRLKRLNAELACAWLSIAEDGDYVWTPLPFDGDFLAELGSRGLPRIIPVTSFRDVPREVQCVPWGWSLDIRRLVERFGWNADAPPDDAVHAANSRSTSARLEQMWNLELPGAQRIESIEDFQNAARSLELSDGRWVVKAEFGMSARERILGRGSARPTDENWVRRRLAISKVVFFEPWVERLSEIGIQFEIPRLGDPQLIGITPMIVGRQGQYAGSWFSITDSSFDAKASLWSDGADAALRAAKYLQSIGYFGPLGVDVMFYRDHDGAHRIRPLQDINARWTMGRLSLGWRRLLGPAEQGAWQHCSTDEIAAPVGINWSRQIKTSPSRVGNASCERMSRILIRAAGLPGASQ